MSRPLQLLVKECGSLWIGCSLRSGAHRVTVSSKVDNKLAISLTKTHVFHDQAYRYHIDLRYHFVHECVEEAKVEIKFVSSENQLADILTKPLG
jgi:hypothetical protein